MLSALRLLTSIQIQTFKTAIEAARVLLRVDDVVQATRKDREQGGSAPVPEEMQEYTYRCRLIKCSMLPLLHTGGFGEVWGHVLPISIVVRVILSTVTSGCVLRHTTFPVLKI